LKVEVPKSAVKRLDLKIDDVLVVVEKGDEMSLERMKRKEDDVDFIAAEAAGC